MWKFVLQCDSIYLAQLNKILHSGVSKENAKSICLYNKFVTLVYNLTYLAL